MSTPVLVGLSMVAIGYSGRYLARYGSQISTYLTRAAANVGRGLSPKFYKGGFDPKMNRQEAALVLGISPTASKARLRDAYKRLIVLNHPDRGGSPYIAAKINEAKELFDKTVK